MAKATTSVLTTGLRGRAGSVVFVQTPQGVVIRPYRVPRDPKTPAQTAARARFRQAIAAWRALTTAQADAWRAYASGQMRVDIHDGTARPRTAYGVFTGLSVKFLQVTPSGDIPLSPPAFAFVGDPITLTATGTSGQIVFASSGPTSPEVRVELLWQRLGSGHQRRTARAYRPQAFAQFPSGSPSRSLPAPPGFYAPAYRFVNAVTGQETELLALDVVTVS